MFIKLKYFAIIFVLSLFVFSFSASAKDKNEVFLDKLENQLFSSTYETEGLTSRLSRLEEIVFGAKYDYENDDIRLERLKTLLSDDSTSESNKVVTQSSTFENIHSTNTSEQNENNTIQYEKYDEFSFLPDNNNVNNELSSNSINYVQPGDQEVEDYPAVSYLENSVFNETYKSEDISKRLNRLETQIFSKTSDGLSLSERLDNLKMAVIGSSNIPQPPRDMGDSNIVYNNANQYNSSGGTYMQNPNFNQQHYFQSPEMNTFQQDPTYPGINEAEYMPAEPGYNTSQLSDESLNEITGKLEEQILGQAYNNQPLNIRLDRLEMQVFNRTSTGYTSESRLERLVSVVAADQTSDPNDLKKIKRLRKIQTGLTVGGLLFSILRGFLF